MLAELHKLFDVVVDVLKGCVLGEFTHFFFQLRPLELLGHLIGQ